MMVDIDRAREALRTLVAIAFKRHDAPFPRFHIPAQKTDDDVVLGDALRELVELRTHLAAVIRCFEEETREGDGINEAHVATYKAAKAALEGR